MTLEVFKDVNARNDGGIARAWEFCCDLQRSWWVVPVGTDDRPPEIKGVVFNERRKKMPPVKVTCTN